MASREPGAPPHGRSGEPDVAGADSLLRLPFDLYARCRLVADAIASVRGQAPLRVLDVGGGPHSMASFLPDAVVTVDRWTPPESWYALRPRRRGDAAVRRPHLRRGGQPRHARARAGRRPRGPAG